MTVEGERQDSYAGEPTRRHRIAARLGVSEEALRLAILAESPRPGKAGIVTLSLRPSDRDYRTIAEQERARRQAELTSITTEVVVIEETVEAQLRIDFDSAIIGAPNEGER